MKTKKIFYVLLLSGLCLVTTGVFAQEDRELTGKAYAGNDDPTNYQISPINGSLDGLGKISVFVGTREILAADTRKLKKLMEAKGIRINYKEYQDMIHVWMLLHFPESKRAKSEIVELIRS
ncbi:MAG TPA: alpha/beta hydrolase fold domain-containing protein [Chryseosolibacter sp.]|nr:alpha/beta hydrolase fold domain-containing protein [Chryseosolibacter sp.]